MEKKTSAIFNLVVFVFIGLALMWNIYRAGAPEYSMFLAAVMIVLYLKDAFL